LLAHGRWFSPGSPASSTTKTGRHDITEILLKVACINRPFANFRLFVLLELFPFNVVKSVQTFQNLNLNLNFGVLCHFQQYFSYIMATSFSGGRSWTTRREPPTMGKQLVNYRVKKAQWKEQWI
jgi:hypothetical protein